MFTLELIDKFLVAGKYEEKKLNFVWSSNVLFKKHKS